MTNDAIYKSTLGEKAIMGLYDEVLAKWPVPHEELTVETGSGKTFVIASGDPSFPPLILLHGSGSCSLAWGSDVIEYSKRFRVYAVDIVGEPGKSAHTRLGWESPEHSVWLDEVISGLGIQKPVILGISLGGWLALKYASAMPEKVAGLVLICPGGIIGVKPSYIGKLLFYSLLGEWGRGRLKNMFFGKISLHEDAQKYFDLCSTHFVYRPASPVLMRDEELSRLTMPVIFIAGEKDLIFDSKKAASRLLSLVPHSHIRILEGKDHVLIDTVSEIIPLLV